jgi:periplasmic protein TonB
MRELFRQVSDPHAAVRNNRLSALPLSIVVHVVALMALVVIPLLASDVLPAVRGNEISWTPITLPSAPPPPPVIVARAAASPASNSDAAPVEPPSGVTRESMIAPAAALDVASPEGGASIPGADLPPGWNSSVVSEPPPPPRPVGPVPARTLVRPPVRVHDVGPLYPEVARLARIEGTVIIEAIIGTTGDVTGARVLRSVLMLDQAAMDAVRQWKYTPTLLNGTPVPVIMTVTVTFSLK